MTVFLAADRRSAVFMYSLGIRWSGASLLQVKETMSQNMEFRTRPGWLPCVNGNGQPCPPAIEA